MRLWGFPGNTVDVTTVAKVKEDLKGRQLTRCLFVGDAGMVSRTNFQALAKGGGKYVVAMPMRRGDEITESILSRPERYRKVAENLEVEEVIVGVRERRRRYAVCFNPLEAKRQKAHRGTLIQELEAEKIGLARMRAMLKLSRLAPDIVEVISRGRQPVGLSLLFFVENPLPDDWNAQWDVIGELVSSP